MIWLDVPLSPPLCHLLGAQVLVTVLVACNTAVAVLGAWLLGADANLSMSLISVAALCFGVVLALKVCVESVESVGKRDQGLHCWAQMPTCLRAWSPSPPSALESSWPSR